MRPLRVAGFRPEVSQPPGAVGLSVDEAPKARNLGNPESEVVHFSA
jgi:hypothetical protein